MRVVNPARMLITPAEAPTSRELEDLSAKKIVTQLKNESAKYDACKVIIQKIAFQ